MTASVQRVSIPFVRDMSMDRALEPVEVPVALTVGDDGQTGRWLHEVTSAPRASEKAAAQAVPTRASDGT